MAKYIVAKIKSTIALAGGRAFFMPAGFTWRNIMNEVVAMKEKRAAVDVFDDLSLTLSHINALLDIMGECDKGQADVNGAAFAIQHMVKGAKTLARSMKWPRPP